MSKLERRKVWFQEKAQSRPEGVCSRYPNCHNLTDGIHKLCDHHREHSLSRKSAFQQRPKQAGTCQVWSCMRPAKPGCTKCEQCSIRESQWAKGSTCKTRRAGRRQEIKAEVLGAYGGKCQCCGEETLAFLTIDHVGRYDGCTPRGGNPLYLWLKAQHYPDGFRVLCQNCNFAMGKFGYCPHGTMTQPFKEREVKERTLRNRESARFYHQDFKMRAFAAYGGPVCSCCGEAHPECLTIDHVNNDGAAHRRELAGKSIYKWLSEEGYPQGFQVLCMNCNFSKKIMGMCWHKIAKLEN